MELCDVCGSFLVIGDTQCRVDAHLLGKQHIGFARIRAAISELRVSRFMLPDFILCVCLYWCQYFCMHYAHTEPLAFSFCWLMHCKVTNTRLDPQVSPLFRQWREWFGACRLSMSSRLAFENWAEILCCMYVCITKGNSVLDIVVVCALVCMPLHSSWYNNPVGVHWSKDTLFVATPKWNMPTHPVRGILQCMYMLEWPHTQAIQPGYEDFTLEAHPLTRISIWDSSFVHVPCNLREKLEKKGLLKLWNPGQRMHNY